MYQVVDACGSCISGASGLSPSMDLHGLHVGIPTNTIATDSVGAGTWCLIANMDRRIVQIMIF